jgi:hypothetical protein
MSVSASVLTAEEYEKRKRFVEEVKLLTATEMDGILKILKASKAEYSENSNGIFFDACKLPAETFDKIQEFIGFCKQNREEFIEYEKEFRRAQDALDNGSA